MEDLTESFEMLMNADLWVQAIVILAAFLAPTVLMNVVGDTVEDLIPISVPAEAYGVGVFVAAQYLPMYRGAASTGATVAVADNVADRTGVKQSILSMGA